MKDNPVLFGDVLRSSVQPWLAELGKSDADRLKTLVGRSKTDKLCLSDCLAAIFPGVEEKKALADFTKLRNRVNDVGGGKPDHGFRLHVDSKKRNPPAERVCWFTGPDQTVQHVESYSQQITADVMGRTFEPSRGLPTSGSAMASGKKMVRFFVSYAHDNQALADGLVKGLKTEFSASRRYAFEPWVDSMILVGKDWHASIQNAIKACDFGLLLVSPAFLGSTYIGEHELPEFVGSTASKPIKPVVPVCLTAIDLDRQDLKGLEKAQIFFCRSERTAEKCYDQMRGASQQRAFAHKLFVAIENRLDDCFQTRPQAACVADAMNGEDVESCLPTPELVKCFQRTKGRGFTLRQLERLETQSPQYPDQSCDAITEITEWACKPDASPFFALLGEYGIGKTTTLKHLTRALLDKRKDNPCVPLPIYVDLRDYMGEPNAVPTIEELLDTVIKRAWKLKDRTVTSNDILRLVREEGALIIFDGLDEKIVHLSPGRAREFIRTLWSVLPDATQRTANVPSGKRRGKLLISCRSHYFRDVGSQNTMLTGESREGIDASDYPAFCLLPFTENQIRDYLTAFLGNAERGKAAFELIASIHNLRDLAERPVLLQLIGDRLGDLEAVQAAGETVNAARLYDLVVRAWLYRDDGKHTIDPLHKRRLMEELAAALWRSGEKQWEADRLEEWLDTFLFENPAIAGVYANKERSLLKEDLRTATFVLRPDTDEKNFRFAHTSLQEYFLACYLARALKERKSERWDLPRVSDETLDFFGQILSLDKDASARQTLDAILGGSCLPAATIAFRYWLEAIKLGYPEPEPSHVNLEGLDAEEWTIRGHSAERLLNLRGANLQRARLSRCRLEWVDLTGAQISGVMAQQSLLLDVIALDVDAGNIDLSGAQWRKGAIDDSIADCVDLKSCQFIGVRLSTSVGAKITDLGAEVVITELPQNKDKIKDRCSIIATNTGHLDAVWSCAWSPDGTRIVTGSMDGVVRIWDATTGRCLQRLVGHNEDIHSCSWGEESNVVVSGSVDGSIRVWNLTTGKCRHVLKGHSGGVAACQFVSAGKYIVTSAEDSSIIFWSAYTGRRIRKITVAEEGYYCCSLASDGATAAIGYEREIRLVDTKSGLCKSVVKTGKRRVWTCSLSSDQKLLAIGFRSGALQIIDLITRQTIGVWHACACAVTSCTWSINGQHLLYCTDNGAIYHICLMSNRCVKLSAEHKRAVVGCMWYPMLDKAVTCSLDGTCKILDVEKGNILTVLQRDTICISSAVWSSNGARIYSLTEDGRIYEWDALSGRRIQTLRHLADGGLELAINAGGDKLLAATGNALEVIDVETGVCDQRLVNSQYLVLSCCWSKDSNIVAGGSDDCMVQLWKLRPEELILCIDGHRCGVLACDFSQDGKYLVSCSLSGEVIVWDVVTRSCLRVFNGRGSMVYACKWSNDGRHILTGSHDCKARIWDMQTGKCVQTLCGHEGAITSVAWDRDNKHILTGSRDATIRKWNVITGVCIATLVGHCGAIKSCAWSPDEKSILSCGEDGTLRVWNAASTNVSWIVNLMPERQYASVVPLKNRVLSASPEAWRWLGWRWKDPETGRTRILPAEYFGPLPVHEIGK